MGRKISVHEISQHDRDDDIWIVLNGRVYDVTRFAPTHPGGSELIYRFAGRDASKAYDSVHSTSLLDEIADSLVGELDPATVTEAWTEDSLARETPASKSGSYTRPPLEDIINLDDFEQAAESTLSPKSWAYNSGAANDNITRDANRAYLQRIWFRPAIMRDVSIVNTKATLFGCDLDIPIYISPVGAAKTICDEGELPLARGAAASGIVQCIATPASYALPEILAQTPKQAWYQVYINKDRATTEALVRQAEQSGKVKALFVTADLPVMSKREDDERIKLDVRSAMSVKISQDRNPEGEKKAGLAKSTSSFIDPSFRWEDLQRLRGITALPILLKGVQRAEDACIAMRVGFDGIVVSNHGGRAADTAPPAILILLEIHRRCPEVFGRMKVFVDGGFRRGSDVVKAVCLGASAVGLGRPFAYALNYGQEGVEHAVDLLKDEIRTAMRLIGLTDLMRDAGPGFLNTADVDHLLPRDHRRGLKGKL